MANSIFLAKLIGPIALVAGIALLLNATGYRAMADEVLRSRPLIFVSGLLSMTAGMALILTHNIWVANWPVIITLIGWLATLSGAARLLVPDKIEAFGRSTLRQRHALTIGGAVWLAIGALLCFFGYFR
jgi:uncharacterized membrane protein